MLIIFGGLPGTGKTTLARALAGRLGAVHLRIDNIEQAILQSANGPQSMDDTGYRVGYAVAEENLRIGHTVIADSVNPVTETRRAWRDVADRAGVPAIEIEILCSDTAEHRRRVETRIADIRGHKLPGWDDVTARDYQPWTTAQLVIDTAQNGIEESLARICAALPKGGA